MENQRLQTLLEFLKEDPFDAFNLYAVALEYSKFDIETALEYFSMLLQTNPDYLGTYYQVGSLLRKQGKEEEAEKIYRTGIEKAIFAGDTHTKAELSNALSNMLLGLDED
jgi:tetratricopeptide (TPR) repeat protein